MIKVLALDVWGNEEDGFDINDYDRSWDLDVAFECTNEFLLKALISEGLINYHVTLAMVRFDDFDTSTLLLDAKTGKPIFEIRNLDEL